MSWPNNGEMTTNELPPPVDRRIRPCRAAFKSGCSAAHRLLDQLLRVRLANNVPKQCIPAEWERCPRFLRECSCGQVKLPSLTCENISVGHNHVAGSDKACDPDWHLRVPECHQSEPTQQVSFLASGMMAAGTLLGATLSEPHP